MEITLPTHADAHKTVATLVSALAETGRCTESVHESATRHRTVVTSPDLLELFFVIPRVLGSSPLEGKLYIHRTKREDPDILSDAEGSALLAAWRHSQTDVSDNNFGFLQGPNSLYTGPASCINSRRRRHNVNVGFQFYTPPPPPTFISLGDNLDERDEEDDRNVDDDDGNDESTDDPGSSHRPVFHRPHWRRSHRITQSAPRSLTHRILLVLLLTHTRVTLTAVWCCIGHWRARACIAWLCSEGTGESSGAQRGTGRARRDATQTTGRLDVPYDCTRRVK